MAKPPDAAARRRPAGARALHGRGHPQGPAGLPAQRAHGVRLGLRPRRLPRPGLHGRLPAARVGLRPAQLRRRAVRLGARRGRSRTSARTATTRRAARSRSPRRRRRRSRRSSATTRASSPSRRRSTGCARRRSPTRTELRQLTAFFGWTAWAASTERPGHNYSYTNNWPPEPRVDNRPTAERDRLVRALADRAARRDRHPVRASSGAGSVLGWHGREQATLSFRAPGDVALTPAQRACAWFFFVMAALFLIQTFVGAASQHYRAELDSFFGFDLAQVFPYNLMRTWHVQLALFWVATSFVAAGIFLAPMIARREPKHQGKLAFALLGALAVVVFGTLIGSFLGHPRRARGRRRRTGSACRASSTSTSRGSGRCCSRSGCSSGSFMLWRVLRGRLRGEHRGNMPWLFFLAALRDPGVLRGRADRAHRRPLHGHRVLALLGRAPLGRGLPRAVHHRDGRLHVRAARRGAREGRADRDLPRHHPVLVRRRHRHDAPPVLLRRAGRAHGARRVLLGRRGDPAHVPDRRGVELPAARRRAGVAVADAVPAPLGGHVPGRRSASGTSSAPASSASSSTCRSSPTTRSAPR